MPNKQLVLFLFAGVSASVYAEDVIQHSQSASFVSYADVLQWGAALIVVLTMFTGFVWLLRKTGGFSLAGKGQLAVITGLSLGMREKLVLVKVGEKQLLLGVTPGRVDKLLELDGEARLFQNQEGNAGLETFASKLQQVMQGKTNA